MLQPQKYSQLWREAIAKWGEQAQLLVMVEELNELAAATLRIALRKNNGRKDDLIDELADVSIMLEQVIFMYGLRVPVERRISYKCLRLGEMLKEGEDDAS